MLSLSTAWIIEKGDKGVTAAEVRTCTRLQEI